MTTEYVRSDRPHDYVCHPRIACFRPRSSFLTVKLHVKSILKSQESLGFETFLTADILWNPPTSLFFPHVLMLKEPVKSGEPPPFFRGPGWQGAPGFAVDPCATDVAPGLWTAPTARSRWVSSNCPSTSRASGWMDGWDVEVRNPGKMGGLWWLMDDLQMIYGWFMEMIYESYMIMLCVMIFTGF